MIDFDELRKTVAIKHNVLLGPEDPILVTVTLHDLVLGRYVAILTAQNESHQKALAGALQEHVELSKTTAGKVITDAADYVSVQVRQAVATVLAEAVAQIRQEAAGARGAGRVAEAGVQTMRSARTTAIIASVVAAFCAVVAVAAVGVVLVK